MFGSRVAVLVWMQRIVLFTPMVCSPLRAQSASDLSGTAALHNWNIQSAIVPPATAATTLSFTVDPAVGGGDWFHVIVESSQIVITLILPGGAEVTAANASALGFQYTTINDGAVPSGLMPSPFALPGTHTVIKLPAGQ